jgi:sulfide:quinone oxidoreductase
LAADLAAYATQKGLTFIQLPVASMAAIPDATVADFAKNYAELPTPIVGFCKSGGRALKVWKQMKEAQ